MAIEYIIPKNKTNIHDFIKKYKNKTFLLKSDKMKMEIEVKLEKTRVNFIKSKLDYYSIYSTSGEFRIDFSYKNKPSFENVYIASIAKSEKHSGSEVVKFVIEFLKSFKQVKKAYLIDAATVNCKNSDDKINLSLYKLLTSYVGFYQKYGFRLVIDYGKEEDITNNMVRLAKKVSNYKVKDILKNFKEIIKFVEKYKQNIQVKSKYNFNEYTTINNLGEFINNIGYLYFTMTPYKKYKFGKFIEKLNDKKCFMLSQLFYSLNNIQYIEFKYKNKKIISNFLVDYLKLFIYTNNFGWNGKYMKKID
jgi:hypothetical protein